MKSLLRFLRAPLTFISLAVMGGSLLPASVSAQATGPTSIPRVDSFIKAVEREILMPIVMLLAAIAFALFVWGVVVFIGAAGDEEKRKTGQQHMLWGIVGLVILFGATGIVKFIGSTIGVVVP